MICNSAFHCRGTADRTVNPAEVVEGKVQGQHRSKVLPLLRETIRQSGQSADRGSNAEVGTLNNACAYSTRIGIADLNLRNCFHHLRWRILLLAFPVSRIDFD